MVSCCLVKGCVNNVRSAKGHRSCSDSLHRVPKTVENKRLWGESLGIRVAEFSDWKRICSSHFTESDFQVNGSLRPQAVPSLNLPRKSTHRAEIHLQKLSAQGETIIVKVGDAIVELIVRRIATGKGETVMKYFESTLKEQSLISTNLHEEQLKAAQAQCRQLRSKLKLLRGTIARTKKAKRVLRTSRDLWIRKWKSQKTSHQVSLTSLHAKSKSNMLKEKQTALEPFSKIFTPAQMEMIVGNKTKTWWSEYDIVRGITLRAKSSRAYNFIREQMKIPLPSISTLKRWTKEIKFSPGILHEVLNLMDKSLSGEPQEHRVCVMSFDEMMIDSRICYDPVEDEILGPKGKMMLVVIRGLFNSWKQPIFYNFDVTFNKDFFDNLLFSINSSGLDPRAVVNDLDGKNRGFWNELGVSYENPFYVNPHTQKRIWFFADVPHMMKLMRNNILDYGLRFPSGQIISKEDFQKLLDAGKSELRIGFKISPKHLEAEGRERQRVYLATQLLSRSVAKAVAYLFPEKKEQATFLEVANDFFDVMNSRLKENSTHTKSAYGLSEEVLRSQNDILDKMESYMLTLKINKRTKTGKQWQGMFPFQKGILTSIRSMRGLYDDLNADAGQHGKFILTHRLNQDVLENCFSVIRSIGIYHDHPTLYEAKQRLKTMLLSWNSDITTGAVQVDDNEPVLTSTLLRSLVEGSADNPSEDTEVAELIEEFNCTPVVPLTPLNWETFMENMSVEFSAELGGQEYVSGFIAMRFKRRFPGLALSSESSDYGRSPQSWCQQLSQGGLTIPSYSWLNLFRNFERYFEEFHSGGGGR